MHPFDKVEERIDEKLEQVSVLVELVGSLAQVHVLVLFDHFADEDQGAGEGVEIFNVLEFILLHLLISFDDVRKYLLHHVYRSPHRVRFDTLLDQNIIDDLSSTRPFRPTQRLQQLKEGLLTGTIAERVSQNVTKDLETFHVAEAHISPICFQIRQNLLHYHWVTQ